jgi:hypothetical protein
MKKDIQKIPKQLILSSAAEYLTFVYTTGDTGAIEVRYEDENIWMTQKAIRHPQVQHLRVFCAPLVYSSYLRVY